MLFKILGWVAVIIGILAIGPSLVPGSISVIGLYISILSLIMAMVSVKSGSYLYLKIVTVVYVLGVLLFNDGSRLFFANPNMTLEYKGYIYSILTVFLIAVGYMIKTAKKANNARIEQMKVGCFT